MTEQYTRNTTNTSGYRGVYFHRSNGRYQARIWINNNPISLGLHNTAIEAAIAYDRFILNNELSHPTNGLLEDEIQI